MNSCRVFVALATLFGTAAAGRADVLFSNFHLFGATDGGAFYSSTSQRFATDFLTGGSPARLTRATMLMQNGDNIPHTFTVSILADNAGAPGALVSAMDTVVTIPSPGPLTGYAATDNGIRLEANTPYWIVVAMNQNAQTGSPAWLFDGGNSTAPGSVYTTIPATLPQTSANSGASYSTWRPDAANYVYTLEGVFVPEPNSVMLAGLAVMGVVWARRVGAAGQRHRRC